MKRQSLTENHEVFFQSLTLACVFAQTGRYPYQLTEREIILAAGYINNLYGTYDISIIKKWLRDTDDNYKKKFTAPLFVTIVQDFVEKSIPGFTTKQDLQHFASLYGSKLELELTREWVKKMKKLGDGPLSEFWQTPIPPIDKVALTEVEKQPEVTDPAKTATPIQEEKVQEETPQIKKAIQPHKILVIFSNEQLDEIYNEMPPEQKKYFRALGVFPQLKAWEILSLCALWNIPKDEAITQMHWLETANLVWKELDRDLYHFDTQTLGYARKKLNAYPTETANAKKWLDRMIVLNEFREKFQDFKTTVPYISLNQMMFHEIQRLSIPSVHWVTGALQRIGSMGKKTSDWDGFVAESTLFTSIEFGIAYQMEQEARVDWNKLGLFATGIIMTATISGLILKDKPIYGILIFPIGTLAIGLLSQSATAWRTRARIKLWENARTNPP